MKLEILSLPNDKLRQKAAVVKAEQLRSEEFQLFINALIETMKTADGVGLAAPQVDHPYRLFVVATDEGAKVFVNPKILMSSWRKEDDEEGCLSIPGVYGLVRRPKSIMIRAWDRYGKLFTIKARGLLARVIQHENDHLNGILFIDKVKRITKGEKQFEEMTGK
jgi:peptide deformylase